MSTRRNPGPSPLSLADVGDEAIFVAAGGRAILLQIAHPGVGAGVADHSDFASRPLARLHGTLTYLYALNYGTDADRAAVRRYVGRAHAPVHGVDADGSAYSAFDGRLQLWVAATLYDSTIVMQERVFGPLDEASKDRIYQDASVIGSALQMPEELWPADRAAFAEYWATESAALRVTPAARRVSSDLLTARAAPAPVRALMPLVRLVTAGLLPAELREPFGFTWSPAQQRRFDRTMRVVTLVYRRIPRGLRTLLPKLYLRRLREGAG